MAIPLTIDRLARHARACELVLLAIMAGTYFGTLPSLRSVEPSLALRTASRHHEGLWKVPARGQPGQIATTAIRLASRSLPRSAQPDHRPWTTHGVAHTSHNPGGGVWIELLTPTRLSEYHS